MDHSPIDVQAHPPERRRRQTVTLPCGCCCCCCCCLHSIGGLVGAVIGSVTSSVTARRPSPYEYLPEGGGDPFVLPPRLRPSSALSASALYWIILALLASLVFVFSFLGFSLENFNRDQMAGLGGAILILAIFLPAVQLVASVIAMIVAGLTDRPNAAARIWTVAKITFGTLIGTGVGLGAMFLICIPFWR